MAAVPEHREPPKPLTTGSGINSRYRRRTTPQDSAENSSGVTTTRKETLLHHSYRSGKYAPDQGDIHINQTPEQNTNHRSRVRGEPLNSPRKDGRRCANIRGCNPRRAPPRPRPTRQHASTIVEPETATPDTPTLPTTRRFTKATPRAGAADPKRSARVHMWPHSRPGPHVHLVRFLREAFQLRSFTILSLICGFRTDSVRRLTTPPDYTAADLVPPRHWGKHTMSQHPPYPDQPVGPTPNPRPGYGQQQQYPGQPPYGMHPMGNDPLPPGRQKRTGLIVGLSLQGSFSSPASSSWCSS